jgi:two-component system phosphate regulon sensor histidine kinase PhoR
VTLLAAAAVFAAIVAIFALLDGRRLRIDLARLADRLSRADPQSLASLGVDDFGNADELARRVNDLRLDLERRLAAEEWQHAILQRIVNGMNEAVAAIDSERRVVLANRRFGEMFALDSGYVGRRVADLVRSSAVFDAFDRAVAREHVTQRFEYAGRRIEMRAFPLPASDSVAAALFIDVTEIERLEQMRRDFISDFTHEARTPLAALRSAIDTFEFAAGNIGPADEQQLRRIMSRQTLRLQRLVDDLAELSGIEAGDMSFERHDVDLRRLIAEVCEDFADRAAQQRLRFVIEGEGIACADALRLQQAFSNLIDNAIKYGGTDTTVDIAIERAVVRISDHGEGIPAEERERIFRRFYRVDKSRSQDVAGTGLGLAITKHLIHRMGGSIAVESEAGRGTTFVVRLPER